jgi:plasmid stability protein
MHALHVNDVPDPIYASIRQRAEASHRSMSDEVIDLLGRELATEPGPQRAEQLLARLDSARERLDPVELGAPSAVELIREDRER